MSTTLSLLIDNLILKRERSFFIIPSRSQANQVAFFWPIINRVSSFRDCWPRVSPSTSHEVSPVADRPLVRLAHFISSALSENCGRFSADLFKDHKNKKPRSDFSNRGLMYENKRPARPLYCLNYIMLFFAD